MKQTRRKTEECSDQRMNHQDNRKNEATETQIVPIYLSSLSIYLSIYLSIISFNNRDTNTALWSIELNVIELKGNLRMLLLLALVALTSAQPAVPTWPAAFSASVTVNDDDGGRHFRWFYDYNVAKERHDSVEQYADEWYISHRILDHKLETEWTVYHQDDFMMCFFNKFNRTMPHPDFSTGWRFVGVADINGKTCNHWMHNDQQRGITAQFFDTTSARIPQRWDINIQGRRAFQIMYHEFDEGPQDPSMFELSRWIIRDMCNPRA